VFHRRCNCSATDEKEFHPLIFSFFVKKKNKKNINQSILREMWQPYLGKKANAIAMP